MRVTLALLAFITCVHITAGAQNNQIDSLRKLLSTTSGDMRENSLEELCYQYFITFRQDSLPVYQKELSQIVLRNKNARLIALSKFYESQSFYRKDTATFFALSRESESLATEAKCKDCLALNALGLGMKYRNLQEYDKSIEKLNTGLEITNGLNEKRFREIKCNLHIALSAVYHYKSNYTEALQHALEASKLAEQLNDPSLKQKVYNSLSAVYGELYSPDNNLGTDADRMHYKSLAKYYMLKTYEGSVMASSKKAAGVAAYNLGLFFSEEKNLDSANLFLNQAIKLGEESNYPELLSNAFNVKGGDYSQHEPDSAMYFFDKAIYYAEQSNFVSNQATAMLSKATILQMKGHQVQAIKLSEEALQLSLQAEVRTTTLNAYKLLAELNEKRGNNAVAYEYFKKHIALKESIVSEENFARIEELKARYDSDLKDNEIKSLSQTAAIQSLELQQRNITLIGLLIFIVFTTIGAVLFFRQRTMVQQQKQLQLENRFLRFQLNPHFLSNALVSIQRFLFESNTVLAADYLGRFSRLMRQFLEYSRKDFITIEDEVEVLRNYLEIQRLGFSQDFNYRIEVDEHLDTALDKIPPMFAQPFVENALEHGIKGMKGGEIKIEFTKKGNHVILSVIDNGAGIKSDKENKSHGSLATTIMRERVSLLNKSAKEKIELQIMGNQNGKGTRVEIRLPIYS